MSKKDYLVCNKHGEFRNCPYCMKIAIHEENKRLQEVNVTLKKRIETLQDLLDECNPEVSAELWAKIIKVRYGN